MGAEGAQRPTGTKGAQRKFLSTLQPNTILKPNPNPHAHPSRKYTPTPTPSPSPKPNQDRILGPSWWGKEHRLGDLNDK